MEEPEFKYHPTAVLLMHVGKVVNYRDVAGKQKKSLLSGNGKRVWLDDVACKPYADTMLVALPDEPVKDFKNE